MTRSWARFRDAYLVEDADAGVSGPALGFVKKAGNVWVIYRLGIPADQQPREVFASRQSAGNKLVELSRQA